MTVATQTSYDAWSPQIFNDVSHVRNWPLVVTDKQDANREVNLRYMKRQWGLEVESYELRQIPSHAKRGDHDSAKLLVMKTTTGETYGKRHNNSQWLSIEV